MNAKGHRVFLLLFIAGAAGWGSASTAAQERSKDIGVVSADELVSRPAKTTTLEAKPVKSSGSAHKYRAPKAFAKRAGPQTEFAGVGVTIRRLQVPEGTKDVEQVGEEAQLEQLATDAPLNIGSHIRIYLEPVKRGGFLYVIDREQFADGSYGEAKLIFPTLRTRQGNNRVGVHELIQIPRPPSYFQINPSKTGKTQVAEVLTIIISPVRLDLPAPLSDHAMTLSAAQLKGWETRWAVAVTPFEMEGGIGKVERAKDMDQVGEEAQLTDDDPLPETVYRATVKKGNPLLVTLPFRFRPND